MLSDLLKDTSLVDDNSKITVDQDIYDKSKGLFTKTISGGSFLKLWSSQAENSNSSENITLLRQARFNFLQSWIEDPNNPTIFPLKLPADDIMNILYAYQTDASRELSCIIKAKTMKECTNNNSSLYTKSLSNWISKEQFDKIWIEALRELYNNSKVFDSHDIIPNAISKKLHNLKELINERRIFEIHNGHAGCGKSTTVIKTCNSEENKNKKSIIISLSNTIGNMFKVKVPQIIPMSCNKAKFGLSSNVPSIIKEIENADIIVLDEFSQWGFEWLDLLIELLTVNDHAEFYVMGDIDQIPTFLSSGSLLYSIIQEFPNNVVQHNTQWRFINNPNYKDLVDNILNDTIPANTMISSLNDTILKQTDCFITGANKNVDYLNSLVLKTRFNIVTPLNNLYDIIVQTKGEIPLISSKTTEINGGKIYRNTRYSVITIVPQERYCVIKSEVDGKLVKCGVNDINFNFDLAYAITVNRAQGLEWENVCCYITSIDKNLKNYNALYVALTRGKQNIIIASDYNNQPISVGDLQNMLKIKYKFYNNFNE